VPEVLIVEDDDLRDLAAYRIGQAGHRVSAVANWPAARAVMADR
jgi:hypothetical protein